MSFEVPKPVPDACQIGRGILVLVVGASGAGKDALISGARTRLSGDARFVFPERTITRAPHGAEHHGWLSDTAFESAERQGQFAITWEAHGLRYGLPASMDEAVWQGRTVIVNGSRATIPAVRNRYARVAVFLVECPIGVRAHRLAQRGRESHATIEARLARMVPAFDPTDADVRIDNSGAIEAGVEAIVVALRSLASGRG